MYHSRKKGLEQHQSQGMIMFKISHLLLLVTAVSFASAAPEQNGKLQIVSLSPDKLRAVYHISAGEGIEVTSEVTDLENHLSIVITSCKL